MSTISTIDFFIDRIIGTVPQPSGIEIPALLAVCDAVCGGVALTETLGDAVQTRLVERGYLRA